METHNSFDTIVIGAGQAGLSVGYHLQRRDRSFLIVDGSERIGNPWRHRWDSLRLFTPARFNSLDGLPFPSHGDHFPTKDEMADYLEEYAAVFDLPVRLGFRIDRLSRLDGRFRVASGDAVLSADNVVVAMSSDQAGRIPEFASQMRKDIRQLHSSEYQRPGQLVDGDALVVGAGNSGVEIALDIRKNRRVFLAGRHPGSIPFDIESMLARKVLGRLVLRGLYHRMLTVETPIGRKARPAIRSKGTPLIRTKPRDVKKAGVQCVPRVAGVRNGQPLLDDGRVIDVPNVIWCTGYHPGFSWIDMDVFGEDEPRHRSGIVDGAPGLYFVGLEFLHSLSSGMVHGVGRDAERIAEAIAARPSVTEPEPALAV